MSTHHHTYLNIYFSTECILLESYHNIDDSVLGNAFGVSGKFMNYRQLRVKVILWSHKTVISLASSCQELFGGEWQSKASPVSLFMDRNYPENVSAFQFYNSCWGPKLQNCNVRSRVTLRWLSLTFVKIEKNDSACQLWSISSEIKHRLPLTSCLLWLYLHLCIEDIYCMWDYLCLMFDEYIF